MVLTAETSVRQSISGQSYTRTGFAAMGTSCNMVFKAGTDDDAARFEKKAIEWVNTFESRYSRFHPDSVVSHINASAGNWIEIDSETEELFALCDWYHWLTGGVFDPTALPLIDLWNYKSTAPSIPPAQEIEARLALVGWRKIERAKGKVRLPQAGMRIDFGGIGKEYAVDRVMEMALALGIQNVLIDFGQDVRVHGEPPEGNLWRVGLQDPLDTGRCWGGVAVTARAVATSGDYLRNFVANGRRYGHIIDPRNGYPADNGCLSVSVVAPTCTEAGILSTSAFILGPDAGIELIERCATAEACIVMQRTRKETRRFHEYLIRERRN